MNENLRLLLDLASDLPKGLRADWDGTNHYEMTAPTDDGGYMWLKLEDLMWENGDISDTQIGYRTGLLMDIAEALKAAEPELKRLLDDE